MPKLQTVPLLGLALVSVALAARYPTFKDEQTILRLAVNGPATVKTLRINGQEAPVGGDAGDWTDISPYVKYGQNTFTFTYDRPSAISWRVSYAEKKGKFRQLYEYTTFGQTASEQRGRLTQSFTVNIPDPRAARKATAGSAAQQVTLKVGSVSPTRVAINGKYALDISRGDQFVDITPFVKKGSNVMVLEGTRANDGAVVQVLYQPTKNKFNALVEKIVYTDQGKPMNERIVFVVP